MSMVKKIVSSLNGEIHVDSEINQGTQVTVHFPLDPAIYHTDSRNNSPSTETRMPPNPVSMLRVECPDKTVAFFGFETVATILLKDSVQFYLTEWYHFSIIRDVQRADFVIIDETSVDDIFSKFAANALPHRIVALRSTTMRDRSLPATIHSILKPVGPYGLAKVLLNCWTRTPPRTPEDELSLTLPAQPEKQVLELRPVQDQLIVVPPEETSKPTQATAIQQPMVEANVVQQVCNFTSKDSTF